MDLSDFETPIDGNEEDDEERDINVKDVNHGTKKKSSSRRKSIRCSGCGKVFKTRESLKAHVCDGSKKEKLYTCEFCKKKYNKRYLKTHLRIHNVDKLIPMAFPQLPAPKTVIFVFILSSSIS